VSRTAADLEAARQEIAAGHNVSVVTHALDLSANPAIKELVAAHPEHRHSGKQRRRHSGRALVRNRRHALASILGLKVFGYINMTRAFYEAMKARKRGVIVNILGVAGERLEATYIAGSTGKRRLDRVYENLRRGFCGRQYPRRRSESRADRDRAA